METGIIKAFPTPFLIEKIDSMVIDTPDFNSEHWKLDSVDNVIKYENQKLTDKIFELVSSFIQELGYVDQPLILNDMWFNRYDEKRPILEHHYHQNCAWTGTYYPYKTNHSTTWYNPLAGMQMAHYPSQTEPTDCTSETLGMANAEAGTIVVHPAYIPHQVAWHGGEESYSVSFDIAYGLPIGNKDFGSYRE